MLSSQGQDQSDQGDEIFLAFKEWLKIQEARHGRVSDHRHGNGSSESHRNEFHVSPAIAPLEPSIGVHPPQPQLANPYNLSRQSIGPKASIPRLCLRLHHHRNCRSRIGLGIERR